MCSIKKYVAEHALLIEFFTKCYPESGRLFELNGRHRIYKDIDQYFIGFWCLYDKGQIVGTVALKELEPLQCELKSLYLYQNYQGKGFGYQLLMHAIQEAKTLGYTTMYLDTLSTSKKAIALYKNVGFTYTKRYNDNVNADVFMVLNLDDSSNVSEC